MKTVQKMQIYFSKSRIVTYLKEVLQTYIRMKKLENLFRVLLIEVEPAPHLRLFEKQLANGSPVPPAGHEH